jgi:hypothetical protein
VIALQEGVLLIGKSEGERVAKARGKREMSQYITV